MTFKLKFQFELSMQIVRHYLTKFQGLAKKASKYKTNYSHFFTMFWYHWIFPWNKFYLLKIIPFKLFVVHFVSSCLLLTSTYPMLLFSYYYLFFRFYFVLLRISMRFLSRYFVTKTYAISFCTQNNQQCLLQSEWE